MYGPADVQLGTGLTAWDAARDGAVVRVGALGHQPKPGTEAAQGGQEEHEHKRGQQQRPFRSPRTLPLVDVRTLPASTAHRLQSLGRVSESAAQRQCAATEGAAMGQLGRGDYLAAWRVVADVGLLATLSPATDQASDQEREPAGRSCESKHDVSGGCVVS